MNTIDTLIVGAGLTGLWLTHRLKLAGHNVVLLEARETLGGRFRRQSQTQPYSSPLLDFFPATQENVSLLEWTKSLSPVPLHIEVREHRPQLYDDAKWKNFSGFGETGFLSVGELTTFSHTHEARVNPGIEQLVRALVEQLPIEGQTMMEVTGLKIEEGKVSEVIVNGEKSFKPERVIFTPHPTILNALIEGEGLPAKHRTRLAKMQSWTAVVLELNHAQPLVEDSDIRIFSHNAKEFEPVVGRAFGTRSKWLTLVPGEREAEHEFVGQCIRHIKRQLKRAWPEAFDGGVDEKIYVQANAFGQHSLKTKEPFKIPEISNLYLANHGLAASPDVLGSLEVARSLEHQLGGEINRLPELGASC